MVKCLKDTDIGRIPNDWEVAHLSQLATLKAGESITSEQIDQFSDYPCYGGNGLRGFTDRYTHDGAFALIGRQGALCGNVIGVEGQFYASEHAVVVQALSHVSIRWLTYMLEAMNLNRYSESSAQPGLSVSKVLALPVAVPPTKTEQEAIAKALSDADSYIESLEQLIAKKRAIMQGAMQELLTGKRRLPGFLTGWETKQLGSVVAIEKGQLVTSSTVSDGSVPVIAGGKRPAYYHAIANRPAHTITISASGANAGYVAFHKRPIFASDCSTVTSGLGYSVEFIYYVLRFRQQDIYSRQAGGAQPHIHPSDLSPLIVSLPKVIDEQRAIAAVLSDMDAELAEQNKTLVKAGNIKQGMMQSLLTGKVRLV